MQKEYENWLKSGRTHLKNGDLALAEENFKKALSIDKDNARAYYYLGIVYEKAHNPDMALHYMQKAAARDTENAEYFYRLGNILYNQFEEYDLAIESYKKALKIDPDFIEALCDLGCVYIVLEEHEKAYENFKKVITLRYGDPGVYIDVGQAYYAIGSFDLAIENLKKAIDLNPDYIEASILLGQAYFQVEEYQLAIESFDRVLEIFPNINVAKQYKKAAEEKLQKKAPPGKKSSKQ